MENRVKDLLPVPYFHVVFTIPHELNHIALQNKRVVYDILFKSAADTLKEVAYRKFGGEIGFTAVLHTWGQNLMDHPHLHMIVAGGALTPNKQSWVSCKTDYLLPLKILSTVFRGKFLSTLEDSYEELSFHGRLTPLREKERFQELLTTASNNTWVVYAKKPFAGPKQVLNYLGQYTHRIAISNHRLIKVEDGKIYFLYRDYADDNKKKVQALDAREFMRRFLLHVLPKKFVRLRHYGFLGNRLRQEKLSACRGILKVNPPETPKEKTWKERLKELTGRDVDLCPQCGEKLLETTLAILQRKTCPELNSS